jgi:hypothetical protein
MTLELHIYAADLDRPLMIEAANVQWVSGQMFGLAFFRITETDRTGANHQRTHGVLVR